MDAPDSHASEEGMVLRLRLSPEDLGKVTFAAAASNSELIGSVQTLQQDSGVGLLDRWRRSVHRRVLVSARPLLDVVPPRGPVPEFLIPRMGAGVSSPPNLDELIEALSQASTDQIRADVAELSTPSPSLRRLAEGDHREVIRLADAVRAYRGAFYEGWRQARPLLQAELAHRAQLLLSGGLDAALADLGPMIRWRRPVLEADIPYDIDVSANGQGLRLVPSVFWPRPVFCQYTITVAYPIHAVSYPGADGWSVDDSLASLLGHTRAAVLRSLVQAGGTSDLARRVGISVASASEHASVLRHAGLIATHRRGQKVHHTLTALGLALVQSSGHWRPQLATQPSA